MKVHITLVGGQPAPVYHGIVAVNPDKVVFIYSNGTLDVVNKITDNIGNIEIDEQPPLDEVEPKLIKERAILLAERYRDDEVSLNISGGLKSWTYFFSVVFSEEPNAAVVYMDQNNILWNYKTGAHESNFVFDMHVLFQLYGNPLSQYKKFSDYTAGDLENMKKVENLRKFCPNVFNRLTILNDVRKNQFYNQKEGTFDDVRDTSSFVQWEKGSNGTNGYVKIYIEGRTARGLRSVEKEMKSPNVVDLVFNAGWFEYKVASMLNKWKRTKEVCLNCVFPFYSNLPKNEVDVILNTGTKVIFVECKTQITRITDIDKFSSVVKSYGGTGSKGLFITDAKMSEICKRKCVDNHLLSFSLQDSDNPQQALERLLENELYNINSN